MITKYRCPYCRSTGRIRQIIEVKDYPGVCALMVAEEIALYRVYVPRRQPFLRQNVEGEQKACDRYCPECHGQGFLLDRPFHRTPGNE